MAYGKKRQGSAAQAYAHARAAGMSPEKAFEWATGRTAESVYTSKGRRGGQGGKGGSGKKKKGY